MSSSDISELSAEARAIRTRFEAEVEPHRRALWHYCKRLTGSAWEAEDLVQDTMLRALAGLARYWQPLNPRAYLFRVATNAWIDQRRRGVIEMEIVELDASDETLDPSGRIEVDEAIAAVVHGLTPLQRVVFLLCETLDFRAGEVATMLDTTPGAVKAALHRARRSIVRQPPPGSGSPSAGITGPGSLPAIVRRYISAFNARDVDAIVELLAEDAITEIVGSAVEVGRETSRRNSLEEWATDPAPQRAEAGAFDGRACVFVFTQDEAGSEALYSVILLSTSTDAVLHVRDHYFCPELLDQAATSLGVPAITHGHQYASG